MQASTICWSWCDDNSWGIWNLYFHVLPDSFRCFFTAVLAHLSFFAKHRKVNRECSSIRLSKRSTSISIGLSDQGESSIFMKEKHSNLAIRNIYFRSDIYVHIDEFFIIWKISRPHIFIHLPLVSKLLQLS